MRITKSFNRDDSPYASPSKSESLIASAEQLPKAPHTGTKAPKLVKIKTWEEKKNFESPRKLKSRSFSESKDDCVNKKKVKDHYFLIIDAILSSQQFDHNIAKKFHYLWSSRFMQRVFRKHQFDLPSQCQYHFPKALEYFSPGYKIDYDDLLNTYLPTTTSPKHDDIELDKERFLLIDTPGASPPLSGAPWQSYWDPSLTIDAIVFVISLGEYLNPLATDPPMTHLQASLDLWKVISSEPQLANIPFILVLNKSDVFEMKKLKNQEYRSVGPENEDKDYSLMKIIESFKDCFGACTMTEFITCTLKKSEIFSVFSTIIKIH
uniref:G domain-containing protein n=1 Tax=Arcella intermedia TaxID=1963864 RepID=A0A6B2L9Z7_9EUKA